MPSILIKVPEEASGDPFLKRLHRPKVPCKAGQEADLGSCAWNQDGGLLSPFTV